MKLIGNYWKQISLFGHGVLQDGSIELETSSSQNNKNWVLFWLIFNLTW
ncbi:MAG: hypothetical protein HLX45_10050 [Bacillus sp. (in: Bacteria)]|nr:hypothetical protein [Bacillus sp. (in: firmicutes)]